MNHAFGMYDIDVVRTQFSVLLAESPNIRRQLEMGTNQVFFPTDIVIWDNDRVSDAKSFRKWMSALTYAYCPLSTVEKVTELLHYVASGNDGFQEVVRSFPQSSLFRDIVDIVQNVHEKKTNHVEDQRLLHLFVKRGLKQLLLTFHPLKEVNPFVLCRICVSHDSVDILAHFVEDALLSCRTIAAKTTFYRTLLIYSVECDNRMCLKLLCGHAIRDGFHLFVYEMIDFAINLRNGNAFLSVLSMTRTLPFEFVQKQLLKNDVQSRYIIHLVDKVKRSDTEEMSKCFRIAFQHRRYDVMHYILSRNSQVSLPWDDCLASCVIGHV